MVTGLLWIIASLLADMDVLMSPAVPSGVKFSICRTVECFFSQEQKYKALLACFTHMFFNQTGKTEYMFL